MDLRELKYFVAVAKYSSFSKASKALYLSQSTLSKAIIKLEAILGVQLIDRSTKQISLTDSGKAIFKQAQLIIQSIDELSSSLNDVKDLKKGTLKIGSPPIIGTLFLPKVISKFHSLYPGIQLETVEYHTKKVSMYVETGEVDLGIVLPPIDSSIFDIYPFIKENLMLVVHLSHELAKKTSVSLRDLQNESFILFKEGYYLHDRFREECIKVGFDPLITNKSSQWDFIYEMVTYNLGITVMPESLCKRFNNPHTRSIPLNGPSIPFDLSIITKKGRYISYATKEFIHHLLANSYNGRFPFTSVTNY